MLVKRLEDMTKFDESKIDYHNRYLTNIPDDIDPKFDMDLWGTIYNLNLIYLDLVSEFFMTDDEIYLYVDDWNDLFNDLRDMIEPEKVMLLSIYLYTQYERITEWCLDMEYYEGLTNLKRFNDLV